MNPRLKELFVNEIKPQLKTKFGYKNEYMVPEIKKIILNMGLGLDGNDNKIIKVCEDDLANIALPRIKDFRGLSIKGFDKFGNYTLGIKEHIIFPEVNFEKVDKIRGLDITIVISSKNSEQSLELLKSFNFPFKLKKEQ